MGIANTPFTVVVSLPEHEHTGSYRVHGIEEIHRSHAIGTYFKFLTDYRAATKASNDKILSFNLENLIDPFLTSLPTLCFCLLN